MATIPVESACPICLISFRQAAKGSTKTRHLFLDGEAQISADPPLAAARAGPAAGTQSAADLGADARVIVLSERICEPVEPRLAAGAWALPRLQPRKQTAVLVHTLDRNSRNDLHMRVRVLGQDDIHGMGFIKGLHHLDAIAQ
jgi:hypothetical protein